MTCTNPPSPKPIIVIVHGAWHNPTHYSSLAAGLRALGYEVLIPRLLSMNGARPPNADLYTDSDHIRSYVESLADAGHSLVVLMHSYGGLVGTNALAGLDTNTRKESHLPGGVVRLVYMCAHAVAKGYSIFGLAKAAGRGQNMLDAMIIAEDGTVECREPRERLLGPGLETKEEDSYVASLRPWNGKGMYQECKATAWMDIPVSYILTLQDRSLLVAYQNAMVTALRAAGREVETFELETGHCAHATMTEKVVEILHTIASRETKEQ